MTEQEIAVKLENHESRIGILESTVSGMQDLILSVRELTISVKNLTQTTEDLKKEVKDIKEKDGNMWRSVKKEVLFIILGLLLGFISSKILI